MLKAKDYLSVIDKTTLTAVDLILYFDNKILLGYRNNSPAKNFWFTMGCRTGKYETQNQALKRVAKKELGIDIDPKKSKLLGVYDHIYKDNFMNNDFGTHYVVASYLIKLDDPTAVIADDQHSKISWMTLDEIRMNKEVHDNVKLYIPEIEKNI